MIEYQREVKETFGYWPAFCDGHIVGFKADSSSIKLKIDYIDSDKSIRSLVEINFSNVSDVQLSEYAEGSVIDTLRILSGSNHKVVLEPCYGLGGSFSCQKIQAKIANA